MLIHEGQPPRSVFSADSASSNLFRHEGALSELSGAKHFLAPSSPRPGITSELFTHSDFSSLNSSGPRLEAPPPPTLAEKVEKSAQRLCELAAEH